MFSTDLVLFARFGSDCPDKYWHDTRHTLGCQCKFIEQFNPNWMAICFIFNTKMSSPPSHSFIVRMHSNQFCFLFGCSGFDKTCDWLSDAAAKMSTSILDRTLASTTSSSSKPSSTPLLAPPSTLAVSSSLQYFYHCLTPDTLILPQQLLYPFPHCRHRHYHRHQLQFQMMFDHQSKQLNMSNTSCMQSNLVETQLEEIIHLCRAMSLQQNRSPLQSTFGHDHTPPNKSCDNCRLARRYSADCVRYLLDESCETVPDNGKECSFGGIAPENVDSTSNKNGCCANMVEHTLNPHQMSSGNNVSNSGGIVTELVAKFEEKLLPKSSLEETQPNSKHLNSSPFVDQSPDDVNVTSKVSPVGRNATPLTFDTADDNIIKQCAKILNGSGGGVHTSPGDADNRRSIGGKRFKPVPVPPPKPEYLAKMVKCSSMEASKAHSVERSVEQQHNNITESRQHHNCCCCCHCSNNLLGIDLSTSINNKCDKHNGSHRKSAKKCGKSHICFTLKKAASKSTRASIEIDSVCAVFHWWIVFEQIA